MYQFLDLHNSYHRLPIPVISLFDKFGFNPEKSKKIGNYRPYCSWKWYPLRKTLYHQHMQSKGSNDQRLSVL